MAVLASTIAKRARGKKAREKGGKATPEQKQDRLSADVVDKRFDPAPKQDTRKSASKAARVSERKIRQADAVATADPALYRQVSRVGQMMAAQKASIGLAKGGAEKGVGRSGKQCGGNFPPHSEKPTFADAGIDKRLASNAIRQVRVACPSLGFTQPRNLATVRQV